LGWVSSDCFFLRINLHLFYFIFRTDGKLPFRDNFAYGKSRFFYKKKKEVYCLACPKFISPAPTIFEQRNDAQWAVRLIMYFHNKKN
jgi:hypothetical protein